MNSASRGARIAAGAVLSALAIFAVWAREPLVREGLWRDEALSVFIAAAPSPSELLERNRIADYSPPLFNAILAGYSRLAGSDELSLKRFALALGLLAAASAAALAWELGGPMAATLAAILVLNNSILLDMSTELRAYSLSAFLASLTLLAAFRIRRRNSARGAAPFVLLAVLTTLLVYSHAAGAVVAAVLFAWGAFEWRRAPGEPFGKCLVVGVLAAGCAYLPWLPTTWRQFRTGLPWETPQPLSGSVAALLDRARLLVPISGGVREPFLLGAVAALGALAAARAPSVRDGIRRAGAGLAVTAVAAAAVWVGLGLYSRQHPRYLTIPATLFSVCLAVLAAIVFDAGMRGGSLWRIAAWLGVSALALAAFDARGAFYRWRVAAAPLSKSGVRDLCRTTPFQAGELVVTAPDYFAPTIWYYCGGRLDLHGFPRWNEPALFDPRGYGALWADPAAVARTLEEVAIGERAAPGGGGFALVSDDAPFVPAYGVRVRELRDALRARYRARSLGRFRGRLESVEADALSARANP